MAKGRKHLREKGPEKMFLCCKLACCDLKRGFLMKMEINESKLCPPDEFPFPFTPYSIQENLMKEIYITIEERKLGIFESPTGTGKSMSLICGSLKWLIDAENRRKEDIQREMKKVEKEISSHSNSVSWLEEHAQQSKSRQHRDALQLCLSRINKKEALIDEIREKVKALKLKNDPHPGVKSFKGKVDTQNKENKLTNEGALVGNDDEDDDDDLLLDEKVMNSNEGKESSESEAEAEAESETREDSYNGLKIYLCSRTHSQLSQLVREIQKSPFKDLNIRVVSLASRQNYCINDSVIRLKHSSLINERCQDLHGKSKGKSTKKSEKGEVMKRQKLSTGCPYYQKSAVENLRNIILTDINDVEQLVQTGISKNACPYYASRSSVEHAQIVVVPYNSILHKSTRTACGIDLKDSVVIIDEAHNLLDTIGNIHSSLVTGQQLGQCYSQLLQYKERFHAKFNSFNLLYLNQLLFIINKLLIKIGGKGGINPKTASPNPNATSIENLAEFILSSEIDNINLYKVLKFAEQSRLVHKLRGYIEKYRPTVVIHKKKEDKGVSGFLKSIAKKGTENPTIADQTPGEEEEDEHTENNPTLPVLSFLESLTNHCLDGRVVTVQGNTLGASTLKFLLLNPAAHFTDIVKESRSVVLAGGTMQPISEFTDQLFFLAGGTKDRIHTFSCGHVIPPENILPIVVKTGPSGTVFDFSYQHRKDKGILDELGRLLVNICNVIPAGVVCFFPSYDYENTVYQYFQQSKVVEKLQNKKRVLREPKKSSKVDEVLREYGKAVETSGAILFSVVGGKLSEGLNFSDDLGRCVVVVGLPYPNLTSPELKEKMNYLNTTVGPTAGKVYYENLCMKAVNQSIGRSVRHKDDYATVLLVDHRYSRPHCLSALPQWIQGSLKVEERFGSVMGSLAKFFASRKNRKL